MRVIGILEQGDVARRVSVRPQFDLIAAAVTGVQPGVQAGDLLLTTTVSSIEHSRTAPRCVDGELGAEHGRDPEPVPEGMEIGAERRRDEHDIVTASLMPSEQGERLPGESATGRSCSANFLPRLDTSLILRPAKTTETASALTASRSRRSRAGTDTWGRISIPPASPACR